MKWLARYPIYPFLFAFILLMSLIIFNAGQILIIYFIRPLMVIWLLTFIVLLAIAKTTKDIHRSGFLVALGLVWFFSFGMTAVSIQLKLLELNKTLIEFVLLAVWIALFVFLGGHWLWRKVSQPMFLTFVLNLVFLIAPLYPIFMNAQYLLQRDAFKQDASRIPFLSEQPLSLNANQTPVIYVIILDSYGRSDVIQDVYQVDNRPFLRELVNRGFYIAEKSHSNYVQTWVSVAALLNFQYHGDWDPPSNPMSSVWYLQAPLFNNSIVPALKEIGYTTISFDTGFHFINLSEVDSFDSPFARLNPLEEILLANTPVQLVADQLDIGVPVYNYRTHVTRLNYIFEALKTTPDVPGPKFVYAHILLPHPPFVFDREGNFVETNRPYSGADGDDFNGSSEEYYFGYREQVQYTSALILDIIDEILAKSETPPIILLQGDHGPGLFYDRDGVEQTCLYERSSILNALYLPGIDQELLYPELSPVNSFRIVLNNYFGTSLELLPDLTYYSTSRDITIMTDVTEIRDSMKNCENLFPHQAVEVFSMPASN